MSLSSVSLSMTPGVLQSASTSMLKKAMDTEASSVGAILDMAPANPAPPASPIPKGQYVDIYV